MWIMEGGRKNNAVRGKSNFGSCTERPWLWERERCLIGWGLSDQGMQVSGGQDGRNVVSDESEKTFYAMWNF